MNDYEAAVRAATRLYMADNSLSQAQMRARVPATLNQGNLSWWLSGKRHSPHITRTLAAFLPAPYTPAPPPARTTPTIAAEDRRIIVTPTAPTAPMAPAGAVGDVVGVVERALARVVLPVDRRDRGGYVYVLSGATAGTLKVGRALDVAERVRTFRCADPSIRVLFTVHCSDYVRAERVAHALLDATDVRRVTTVGAGIEWFRVDRLHAMAAVMCATATVEALPLAE
jgi:hypothetical protein